MRGLHGLSCNFCDERYTRHAVRNGIIKQGLQTAGVSSNLVTVGVDRGDDNRPDGTTVFPRSNGVVCAGTPVQTPMPILTYSSAVSVGHAAQEAEERKRRKYGALGGRFRFEPVAVETAGVYGEITAALISEIGRRITDAIGESRDPLA